MAAGFAGILNYPTVAVIDGRMRQDLEHGGMGLAKEVAPIEQAALLDLLTTAYVCTVEEAEAMVRAGVHVIIAHLGLTVGVSVGGHHAMAIDELARGVQAILALPTAGRGPSPRPPQQRPRLRPHLLRDAPRQPAQGSREGPTCLS